jgi:hypothetical protein
VAYAVLDGQCELQGASSVLLTGAGFCSVQATQAGNAQWLPAPVAQMRFDIANGDSDFRLEAPTTVPYPVSSVPVTVTVTVTIKDVIGSEQFNMSADGVCSDGADLNGPVSFEIALTAIGSCTVTVSQNGTQDFNIGPTRTVTIQATAA